MSIYAAIRPYIHFVLQVRTHYNIHQSKLASQAMFPVRKATQRRRNMLPRFIVFTQKKKMSCISHRVELLGTFEEVCTIHTHQQAANPTFLICKGVLGPFGLKQCETKIRYRLQYGPKVSVSVSKTFFFPNPKLFFLKINLAIQK